MLNPNDIANKKFEKSMGRYKIEEVERYLSGLADDVAELLDEKSAVEQKLIVLADKLEEYKRDEESLQSALLGAQKLGDSVVRDSRLKAANILEDAKANADQMIENARRTVEQEQLSFVRMQREVATFKSRLQLLYKQHLELISAIPVAENLNAAAAQKVPDLSYAEQEPVAETIQEELPPIDQPTDPQLDFEVEIADVGGAIYTDDLLEYTEADQPYRPASEEEPLEEQQQKRESRFGTLKFGKEFDIKRDDEKRKK